MLESRKLARAYLKSLKFKEDFEELERVLVLYPREVLLLHELYLKGNNLSVASHNMGYSIQLVKVIHGNVLDKVNAYLRDKLAPR